MISTSLPRYDLLIKAGVTFERTWKLVRGATPVDVTGWHAWLQVRRKPGSPVIVELATAGHPQALAGLGRFTTLGVAGFYGKLLVPETEGLVPGSYLYDMLILDPITSVLYDASEGSCVIAPFITGSA
jgi:hypothetical protein